ncbi:MAG TPA: hypothetical protein VHC47_15165 [Mucilaginibacter sp.]|nr:hypothetical protein [Mucilaginibacter sp.]
MTTIKIHAPVNHTESKTSDLRHSNIFTRLMAYAENHPQSNTSVFLVSLIVQGILFLPVPAALMYYYNAPMVVLVITMTLFFANIIAGMGGAGIKTLLSLFALSVVVHLLMIAIFII